jgi:hypothetical protein
MVFALDPSELAQPQHERCQTRLPSWIGHIAGHEHGNALGLLRARSDRPGDGTRCGRRAAEARDEFAPSHRASLHAISRAGGLLILGRGTPLAL